MDTASIRTQLKISQHWWKGFQMPTYHVVMYYFISYSWM